MRQGQRQWQRTAEKWQSLADRHRKTKDITTNYEKAQKPKDKKDKNQRELRSNVDASNFTCHWRHWTRLKCSIMLSMCRYRWFICCLCEFCFRFVFQQVDLCIDKSAFVHRVCDDSEKCTKEVESRSGSRRRLIEIIYLNI